MTITDLIKKTTELLITVRHKDEPLEEYIINILSHYQEDVCELEIDTDWDKDSVLKDISDIKEAITNSLKDYSSAHIDDSIKHIKEILKDKKLLTLEIDSEDKEYSKWFRMRKSEANHHTFPANEMFHIPFQSRGKVNTQRYSLPGYPCLYISRSIWATWEEMHEPNLANFCVSRLQPISSFKVLDLRIIDKNILSRNDIKDILCTIPLTIACSIKVRNPDDNFKPEYIIPQLVMLALVDDADRYGCAYTSTQRNPLFEWDLRKLDNIALPVKMIQSKGFCSKLCNLFRITDATNYEYEMLKKPFETSFWVTVDDYGMRDESKEYANSIFGQMESRLENMELKVIKNDA